MQPKGEGRWMRVLRDWLLYLLFAVTFVASSALAIGEGYAYWFCFLPDGYLHPGGSRDTTSLNRDTR